MKEVYDSVYAVLNSASGEEKQVMGYLLSKQKDDVSFDIGKFVQKIGKNVNLNSISNTLNALETLERVRIETKDEMGNIMSAPAVTLGTLKLDVKNNVYTIPVNIMRA